MCLTLKLLSKYKPIRAKNTHTHTLTSVPPTTLSTHARLRHYDNGIRINTRAHERATEPVRRARAIASQTRCRQNVFGRGYHRLANGVHVFSRSIKGGGGGDSHDGHVSRMRTPPSLGYDRPAHSNTTPHRPSIRRLSPSHSFSHSATCPLSYRFTFACKTAKYCFVCCFFVVVGVGCWVVWRDDAVACPKRPEQIVCCYHAG